MVDEDNAEHVTEIEAKGGRRVAGMPLVLGIGTIAAIILIGIVFLMTAA